jgi:glycosyltransferase involved in cell wall biosynthesis
MLHELYGWGDPEACQVFARILDTEAPDVVHVHALTRAVSILLVRAAKERSIPVFFTYHVSTVSCQRGNLLLHGRTVCDGVLELRRCTDCSLANEGLPRWASKPLSYVPSVFANVLEKANLSGGVWTALRMADLIRTRCEAFHLLMQDVDGVVALREWTRELLVRNGVPRSKITLSPHGLIGKSNRSERLVDIQSQPLRVAYLGRFSRGKGIETLIMAVKAAPELDIEVHLYGMTQDSADQSYQTMLRLLSAFDARVSFLPPVAHEQVIRLLANYHLLAVPSHWVETGPLVVLESFAAGTPVIGSDLGGIAELVQHEKNGLLVRFADVRAWTNALERCARDRKLLGKLREGVQEPRSMADVARDMVRMYRRQPNSKTRAPANP